MRQKLIIDVKTILYDDSNMKKLDMREQIFVAEYLNSFNAKQAAIKAGYAESVAITRAFEWVSMTQCPPYKLHVRDAIQSEIEKIYGLEKIDKGWLLRRAKLLAEFSIGKFIRKDGEKAYYDFSEATPDDWWCLEEYVTEGTLKNVAGGERVSVEKVRIRAPSKIAALKLLGDHVDVAAFRENVEISGQITEIKMSAKQYKKARQEMLHEDDC